MMKITDAHSHLMVKFLMYREAGVEQNIQMMKKAGIDRACLFTSDFLSTEGSLTPKAWEEQTNRKIAESVESHPTRLVGFGTVDPRIEGAAERLDSFVAKYGFRGAKFHPWHQDFPCGDVMHPIMEVAARHRLPIVFHSGTPVYAQPLAIAWLAEYFPDVPIVLAHMGLTCMYVDAVHAAKRYENVFLETSCMPYTPVLERAVSELGPHKILFGTDTPFLYPYIEILRIQRLAINDDDKEMILGGNIERLIDRSA